MGAPEFAGPTLGDAFRGNCKAGCLRLGHPAITTAYQRCAVLSTLYTRVKKQEELGVRGPRRDFALVIASS